MQTLTRGLLISAIALALTLSGLEIGVRWFFPDEVDPDVLQEQLQGSSVRALVEPSTDPALFFELKPSLRVWAQGTWMITSPDRFRISPPKPRAASATSEAPRYRIAIVGDSTSFGWGVSYDDTYPERYRRRLAEIASAPIELRNYSVPAYNALQELRTFETKIRAYRPDLLIVHHDHNDADPTSKMMGDAYMPVEYGDNLLHSALIKWSVRRLRQLRNEGARSVEETGHRRVGGYLAGGPLYQAQLDARRALAGEATTLGIPVIAVIFNAFVSRDPSYERSKVYTELHANLATKLAAMGYHVLDLYPRYQTLLTQRGWPNLMPLWLSPTDGHPNVQGHQFIADELVSFTLKDPRLAAVFGIEGR